jgi:serine/threonine protein kinase
VSTDAYPADWGEPPPTPEEESTAAVLERVMAALERGETPWPQEELARDLEIVRHCAGAFHRHAGLLDDSRSASAQTLAPSEVAASCSEVLPDPFPGEYRLLKRLGRGAFGEVWLAEDLNLGWQVALKTLRLAGAGTPADRLAALRREARTLAGLRHRNIVQVHAWRQAGDEHYLVMQYVPGGSLEDRVRQHGPLPWELAARYVADVGEGLVAVHGAGLVHRDIKPANILWQPEGDEALLTDFGIAARLVDPGQVAGTPLFMSPEAICGQVSPAMDVYSLAATLFWLVTGAMPFTPALDSDVSTLLLELRQRIERGLPDPDPRCADLPRPLERLLRKGLAADAGQRRPLREFVAALRGLLNQLLADSLTLPPAAGAAPAVELRLVVSRKVAADRFQPVATTHPQPDAVQRNMKKVPRPPEQVRLRTGDEVRVEVTASREGYVTVFNVGPTGDLNLLYPDEPPTATTPPTIKANEPLVRHEVADITAVLQGTC